MKELIKKYREIQESLTNSLKDFFEKENNEFFRENPQCPDFEVAAYCPSWNDGEPCEYGVNWETYNDFEDVNEAKKANTFLKKFEELPDEIIEKAFGNVKLKFSKGGFTTEEYNEY
jgi:hypothetical protein